MNGNHMSLDILTIKYTDHDADKQFEYSIKHSGFAVITHHPIESALIDDVYEDWLYRKQNFYTIFTDEIRPFVEEFEPLVTEFFANESKTPGS